MVGFPPIPEFQIRFSEAGRQECVYLCLSARAGRAWMPLTKTGRHSGTTALVQSMAGGDVAGLCYGSDLPGGGLYNFHQKLEQQRATMLPGSLRDRGPGRAMRQKPIHNPHDTAVDSLRRSADGGGGHRGRKSGAAKVGNQARLWPRNRGAENTSAGHTMEVCASQPILRDINVEHCYGNRKDAVHPGEPYNAWGFLDRDASGRIGVAVRRSHT